MTPGEFIHRHQFDMRDSQVDEVIEMRDDPLAGSILRKRADVQLVHDSLVKGGHAPLVMSPSKLIVIHQARGTGNT